MNENPGFQPTPPLPGPITPPSQFEPFVYFETSGVTYSAINCPVCDHRTPAGVVCLGCQLNPSFRCYNCFRRGGVPVGSNQQAMQFDGSPIGQRRNNDLLNESHWGV